jgi:hypothetical protein
LKKRLKRKSKKRSKALNVIRDALVNMHLIRDIQRDSELGRRRHSSGFNIYDLVSSMFACFAMQRRVHDGMFMSKPGLHVAFARILDFSAFSFREFEH